MTLNTAGVLHSLYRDGILSYERAAADLLSEVQVNQDIGVPWGEALKSAIAVLEGNR